MGCFSFLAIESYSFKYFVQVLVFIYMLISFRCILRSRIARSYGNSMFNHLCQTAFQSGCIILQSHQQRMWVLISLYPYQHLL